MKIGMKAIVEGKKTVDVKKLISKIIYVPELRDGIVVGMENGDILIGTKKEERTVAAGALQNN